MLYHLRNVVLILCLSSTLSVSLPAQVVIGSVAVGAGPIALAVNPTTNKIYVAYTCGSDLCSGGLSVIDGVNNSAKSFAVGMQTPRAVAVNPATNKIYVAGGGYDQKDLGAVAIIDGATDAITIVSAGYGSDAVAINFATNKIYVVNLCGADSSCSSGTVTVMDGTTNETTTVRVGYRPLALAVNPLTNKIYVTNYGGNVTAIDGATNETTTITIGNYPWALAVNSVTNKIYVLNNSGIVTVIDGLTNEPSQISVADAAWGASSIAVNAVTNKIYVVDFHNSVTLIDGVTNNTTSVDGTGTGGADSPSEAVNSVTNTIYVTNSGPGEERGIITVIDGYSNATTAIPAGLNPIALAINSTTNRIYVANFSGGNVTVIDGTSSQSAFLSFPLQYRNAFDAKIISVFDHSSNWQYCADDVVTAYDGEKGTSQYHQDKKPSNPKCYLTGFSNLAYGFAQAGYKAFYINGQYIGADGDKQNHPGVDFLEYDGHPGYDFETKDQGNGSGEIPVLAAANGIVVCSNVPSGRTNKGKAYCIEGPGEIKIKHPNGYFSIYLHLSSCSVTGGDQVSSQQQIGISGDTGVKNNPHLHFEVRRGNSACSSDSKCVCTLNQTEDDTNCIPVDPYGWSGDPEIDPYMHDNIPVLNIPLWK